MSLICCYCGCASEGVYGIDSPLDGEPDEELCNFCAKDTGPSVAEIHRKLELEEPVLRELRLAHNTREVELWRVTHPKRFAVWEKAHQPVTATPATTP